MSYTAIAERAYGMVQGRGTAVTFTLSSPGTQSATTGQYSGATTTTVTGVAIECGKNPTLYQQLALVESDAPTLLFCPDTYGDAPDLQSSVSWRGLTYVVRNVTQLAPDGTAILSRVVVSR